MFSQTPVSFFVSLCLRVCLTNSSLSLYRTGADNGGLPEARARRLMHSLVGQGARPIEDIAPILIAHTIHTHDTPHNTTRRSTTRYAASHATHNSTTHNSTATQHCTTRFDTDTETHTTKNVSKQACKRAGRQGDKQTN